MNVVHAHLALTHFPVVGVVGAALLLTAALVGRSQEIRRLALASLVLVGLVALPVYFTGEPAQDALERLPGISERVIDRHEDAATAALVGAGVLGALALGGLLVHWRKGVPRWFVAAMLLLSIAASGLLAWTANLGGQIRHTEILAAAISERETD